MTRSACSPFRGRTVVVSGASSGIGRAVALCLARRGANVALTARRADRLAETARQIESLGGAAMYAACDVQDRAAVYAATQAIRARWGDPHALFIAAGVGSRQIAQNCDSDEAERVMRTNYLGAIHWMEQVLPAMQRVNDGVIVAVSSLASYRGLPGCGSYCASKAALTTLFESYRTDLQATNIHLCVASPYYVATALSGAEGENPGGSWSTPHQAAERIVSAAERRASHVAFPAFFRLFMYALRVMPIPAFRLFWRLAKRGG